MLQNKSGQYINPATEDKQDDIKNSLENLVGFEIPPFDEIDMTYVVSGNGIGQIHTAIYSLASTPHTTLTITYNSDDKISNVTKT